MSARSADTARDRGRAVDALIAASATELPSTPWPSARKSQDLDVADTRKRGDYSGRDAPQFRHDDRQPCHHHPNATTDDEAESDTRATALDRDDDLLGAVDHLLSSDKRGREPAGGLDLCSSTWKSVETMARALAAGQSVLSTISKCYSLPGLTQDSSPPGAAADLGRSAREAGADTMHSSLVSGRFAARALAIFRRYSLFATINVLTQGTTRGRT